MNDHKVACMTDLETLDATPAAAILSIGAVIFLPYSPEFTVIKSFYKVLHVDGQERNISQDTLAWWMTRESDAKALFKTPNADKVYLHDALAEFEEFSNEFNHDGNLEHWAKPANFDYSILAHAYDQYGMEPPWNHRKIRCFRTLCDENPNSPVPNPDAGVKHNALDDALYQARWLHMIRKHQLLVNAKI